MKNGTHNHIKTKRLKRLLGVPLFQAVGILETLWQLTTDCCDEGNIGKFSDEEIADYLEWQGEPKTLIDALLGSGWLDEDEEFRYVIHDWLEHCPDYIRERVRKRDARAKPRKQTTYDKSTRDNGGQERDKSGQTRDMSGNVPSIPNPTQPIQTQPNQTKEAPAAKAAAPPSLVLPSVLDTEDFRQAWLVWVRHRSEIKKPIKPTQTAAMIDQLAGWGETRAIAAIRHTVAMGWQGLREPESQATKGGQSKPVIPKIGGYEHDT